MGTVYLGSDGSRTAAVKVIAAGIADDPAFRSRFRREIDVCRRVSGPQVAELLDAGPDDPQPWLAVRYVPGPTLREAIERHGPLTGDTLHGFAVAVAAALDQIHTSGVVHRDLKPSNVILTPDTPVIIDFGIAGVAEATSLTATGAVLGSAGWMAPEQILGEATGPPADVFSWAAVVAYAATGRAPFGEGRPEALSYRIVHGEPDLEGIDEDLRAVLARALRRNPAERPGIDAVLGALNGSADATQVAAGIATAWVNSDTTAIAQPETIIDAPPPVATRRKVPGVLTAATVAVVVAMVAGIVLFLRTNSDADPQAQVKTVTTTTAVDTTAPGTTAATTTTTTTAPTTTVPPPVSVREIDLENRSYDIFCDGSGAITTIDVVDGSWTHPDGPTYGSLNGLTVTYGDVTGDGSEDAIVNMDCSVGVGSNAWGNTVVVESTTDGVNQVGQPIPSRTWLVDGKLIGETFYFEDSDPMCCPSSVDQSTWSLRNGGWSQEGINRIPAEESYTYSGE